MSGIYRRSDILEHPPYLLSSETTIFSPSPGRIDFDFFCEESDITYRPDLFNPNHNVFDLHLSPFEESDTGSLFQAFDTITDLIHIERTPFSSSYRRVQYQSGPSGRCYRSLCDRVSGLELGVDRRNVEMEDRNYRWAAEIKRAEKNGVGGRYEWTEIKGGKEAGHGVDGRYEWMDMKRGKEAGHGVDGRCEWMDMKRGKEEGHGVDGRCEWIDMKRGKEAGHGVDGRYEWTDMKRGKEAGYGVDGMYAWTDMKRGRESVFENKWTAEINKGRGKVAQPMSPGVKIRDVGALGGVQYCGGSGKKSGTKKGSSSMRMVEIEEPVHHGAVIAKQGFSKRAGAIAKMKGKRKVLSTQDAAHMIQISFRAYLFRRSQSLRSLRELAVAKARLKEIRASYNNFSYRRLIARDMEERQRFSERIIVLLLTVDAIEGVNLLVRAARKSMVKEMESMLDVVDPKPSGKPGSMRRRKFDLPQGGVQNEIAAGVAEVVQMLDQAEKYDNDTFEVCL